jgi:hypothetical protein
MKFLRALIVVGLMAALPAWAVYAPIPEQDQGKDFTATLRAGISHDSNLFGAASGAIDSMVYELAPRFSYNASLTAQTFLAAGYGLTLDYFDNRPGDKLLDSHEASLRLAHAFSQSTTIDLNNVFMITRNPESLLAGVPLNSDQSFQRNQLDARFGTALTGKIGLTVKARTVYFNYRNAALGRSLDRAENLYGAAGDYAILPEVKAVVEFRHQDLYYTKSGETKNKSSEFLMAGVDYAAAKKILITGRLGAEWRRRAAERNTTAPYAEFSIKYDYAEMSYLSGGYGYTLEEASDTARFTDSSVHRLFVNVQHRLTPLITASTSVAYDISELQGRRGITNVDENTLRFGAALAYLPTTHWTLSASFDHDRSHSDDRGRNLQRERFGLNATYAF